MNEQIQSTLESFQQQHLLQFYYELDQVAQSSLTTQIESIDFQQVAELHARFGKADAWAELAKRAEPPTALRLRDDGSNDISRDQAVNEGFNALRNGKVGMILVAGGQGSRLGFQHPKGMYPLSPVRQQTLFQIHIEKLKAISEHVGCVVPLYVMTSPATHQESIDFLKAHEWFGYSSDHATIFCQGTMPAVDSDTGKVLLAAKDQLFASPDGHGGMLAALENQNCLADMKRRELAQVFYCQVDNPLSQICDPATIGYHILAKSEMSSQAVPKQGPLQKVGNIVSIDNRVQIIEYSDLPDEVAQRTNADGSLVFWAGNIAVHVFDVDFLDRMKDQAEALPFHLAHKKVPHIDTQGSLVQPSEPNAVKFERFIFDLLPMAKHSIVIEVDPADAFSPVKNAPGESSNTAATAQAAMMDQWANALQKVGVQVADGVKIEISPALMLDPEKLKAATDGLSVIDSDRILT